MSSGLGAVAAAVFAPWRLATREPRLHRSVAALVAAASILTAAIGAAALSTWTYLAGKGLLMRPGEMDLGADDLPPDSIRQVAMGLVGSIATWALLLLLILLVCAAVADCLYGTDRARVRAAIARASVAAVWFVLWSAAVFAANAAREDEIRHPAAAVRAYAQLNQHGFRGSSAVPHDVVERQPLAGRGRLLPLAVLFPIVWSVTLPAPSRRRLPRPALIGAAIVLSWLAWWIAWRVLPWVTIEALVG